MTLRARATLLWLLAACTAPPPAAPEAPAPAPAPALAASTASPAPAPGPTSAAALLRSAAAVEPGQRLALAPGAEVVVDPAATFELELAASTSDARLVLLDARDDLVPAASTREVGAATRLTLAPAAPLVPGSRYALRLDGAAERELHDAAGRPYGPVILPLLAAGTPPPPEPKRPARKKRRH